MWVTASFKSVTTPPLILHPFSHVCPRSHFRSENISRVTQLINAPENTRVGLLIPASLNHSVFHLSLLMKRPRLCGVLFWYAAPAAAAASSWEIFKSFHKSCSVLLRQDAAELQVTFTVFGNTCSASDELNSRLFLLLFPLWKISDATLHSNCVPSVWIPPFVLLPSPPFGVCSLPTRTACKGFGILKAETLRYVAH